jgi:hypothetical protein
MEETGKDITMEVTPDYIIVSRKAVDIWPAGTEFEQGRAAYFYAIKPQVNVTPIIEINDMEQGIINGTIYSQVSIASINDKSEIYWSHEIKETQVEQFTLSKGISGEDDKTVFSSFGVRLDVLAAYDEITKIGEELFFQTGNFQLIVTSNIHINGTINGSPIDKTFVLQLPLSLQQVSFTIPSSQEVMVQVALGKSPISLTTKELLIEKVRENLLLILIDVGLALILLYLLMTKQKTLNTSMEHRRFKEWITEGSVEVFNRLRINIFSLEGLVDLAIDLDKRVIYDSSIKKYFVLTEDIVYGYDPERKINLMDSKQMLGKLLLERNLISAEQLEMGLYYQQKIGSRLGESLVALGFIGEATLYSTLAAQRQMDYFELDSTIEYTNSKWLDQMGIKKARALMALPLGQRSDGTLVIACSEASKEGIQKVLHEMFGSEIYLVATRPSVLNEVLTRIERNEKRKAMSSTEQSDNNIPSFEPLNNKESEQFRTSYYRGNINNELLLKASGLVSLDILNEALEHEPLLNWLVNKHFITSEITNLLIGLAKSVEVMEIGIRKEKQVPELISLLLYANYITQDSVDWINRELELQERKIDQLLKDNFLASEETMAQAIYLLDILEHILKGV